jgi:AraC family ethanolamine operon transcriptional activator
MALRCLADTPSPRPAPLFPPGLLVDVRASSGAELPIAPTGWDVRYAQLETGRLRSRFVGLHTAVTQVCVEDWSLGMLKQGRAPRGSVSFAVPVGRNGTPRIQGRGVASGEVVVLFDGDEVDYRSEGPSRLVSVTMERSALERHVRALAGRHLGELRLQGRLGGLRTDPAALVGLCQSLAARAAARPRLLRCPAVASGLERRLIKLLFAQLEAPRAPEAQRRGRVLARRAEAWLRANLADPPTIAALCGAVHASQRTLHDAFREHLRTTPKAYLKTLRLNAARRDLLGGGPGTTVTSVALDWGFLHFGWFSQDYRRLFGETPSRTLKRGRAQVQRHGVAGRGPRSKGTEPGRLAAVAM